MTDRKATEGPFDARYPALHAAVKEAFSRWHRGEHDEVLLIEQDVMLALAEHLPLSRRAMEMPCFCGTADAFRCPRHINPVQLTSGGR